MKEKVSRQTERRKRGSCFLSVLTRVTKRTNSRHANNQFADPTKIVHAYVGRGESVKNVGSSDVRPLRVGPTAQLPTKHPSCELESGYKCIKASKTFILPILDRK